MVCNAIMASGMAHLADLIEGGLSHRDAVAKMFKDDPGWSFERIQKKAADCNMWRTCTLLLHVFTPLSDVDRSKDV